MDTKEKNSGAKPRVSKVAERLQKKRYVVSYANMSAELAASFKEKYPRGYADYMGDIFKVDKPDGTFFFAVSIEIPEAVYLVKVDVKIDTDYEEVEDEIFGDGDDAASADGEESTFPDNDSSNSYDADADGDN